MKSKGMIIGFCIADALLIVLFVFLFLRLDRTAPVIVFTGTDFVYAEEMDEAALLEGVAAMDEVDGDVSSSLIIEKVSGTAKGDVIVTYAALDSSNNVAKSSRILRSAENIEEELPVTEETAVPETETEIENETETETETDAEAENPDEEGEAEGQDDEENITARRDEEPRQAEDEPNNRPQGQNTAGADRTPVENSRENVAPVMQLTQTQLTVPVGSVGVNWNDCIGQMTDDTDSHADLFANLSMEGILDLTMPGEYAVNLYTRDSDGAESIRQTVVVKVE